MSYSITWRYRKDRALVSRVYQGEYFSSPEKAEEWFNEEVLKHNYTWYDKYYWYIVDDTDKVFRSNDPDVELEKEETQGKEAPVNMFFTFYQNNSHGTWTYYKYVIIEAEDADEANEMIINDKGYDYVYFDKRPGDCTCCGPRWNKVTDFDATENPTINGIDLYDPSQDTSTITGPYFIIYKDYKNADGTSCICKCGCTR